MVGESDEESKTDVTSRGITTSGGIYIYINNISGRPQSPGWR